MFSLTQKHLVDSGTLMLMQAFHMMFVVLFLMSDAKQGFCTISI